LEFRKRHFPVHAIMDSEVVGTAKQALESDLRPNSLRKPFECAGIEVVIDLAYSRRNAFAVPHGGET
jgi:hypothetical protein